MIVHKSGPIALIGGAAMPKPVLERALTLSVGIVAADGGAGVSNLLELIDKEMRVAMTLTGAKTIADINSDCLVKLSN